MNDLGAMELLPVRSFFADALTNLYVLSGQKIADERARELKERIPAVPDGDAARWEDSAGGGSGGALGLGGENSRGAGAGAAGEAGSSEVRSSRVRRFRS